jgi:hypothetical protein
MSKYHVNKNGVPAPCKAQKGNCPFGGEDKHFSTREKAQEYADQKAAKEYGIITLEEFEGSSYNSEDMVFFVPEDKTPEQSVVFDKIEGLKGSFNDDQIVYGIYNEMNPDETALFTSDFLYVVDGEKYFEDKTDPSEIFEGMIDLYGSTEVIKGLSVLLSPNDILQKITKLERRWG